MSPSSTASTPSTPLTASMPTTPPVNPNPAKTYKRSLGSAQPRGVNPVVAQQPPTQLFAPQSQPGVSYPPHTFNPMHISHCVPCTEYTIRLAQLLQSPSLQLAPSTAPTIAPRIAPHTAVHSQDALDRHYMMQQVPLGRKQASQVAFAPTLFQPPLQPRTQPSQAQPQSLDSQGTDVTFLFRMQDTDQAHMRIYIQQHEQTTAALRSDKLQLEARVTQLATTTGQQQTEISMLKNQVTEQKTQLSTAEQEIHALRSEVDRLQALAREREAKWEEKWSTRRAVVVEEMKEEIFKCFSCLKEATLTDSLCFWPMACEKHYLCSGCLRDAMTIKVTLVMPCSKSLTGITTTSTVTTKEARNTMQALLAQWLIGTPSFELQSLHDIVWKLHQPSALPHCCGEFVPQQWVSKFFTQAYAVLCRRRLQYGKLFQPLVELLRKEEMYLVVCVHCNALLTSQKLKSDEVGLEAMRDHLCLFYRCAECKKSVAEEIQVRQVYQTFDHITETWGLSTFMLGSILDTLNKKRKTEKPE